MHTTTLRAVGGSVMFAIPKALLESLDLHANQQVDVSLVGGQMVVAPRAKPRYTLAALLQECDADAPLSGEEQQWLDLPDAGREAF
jgi:antitoxin ChpS